MTHIPTKPFQGFRLPMPYAVATVAARTAAEAKELCRRKNAEGKAAREAKDRKRAARLAQLAEDTAAAGKKTAPATPRAKKPQAALDFVAIYRARNARGGR